MPVRSMPRLCRHPLDPSREGVGRRAALTGLASLALAGCGFQLRRAPTLGFQTVYLNGFESQSALARELRRQIGSSESTQVVFTPSQAQVILSAVADTRDKSVVVSSSAGQVREVQLRRRFVFSLKTASGRELIGPSAIELTRDMTYNERDALAKEHEEEALFRAMQSDIAQQVLRRLASVGDL